MPSSTWIGHADEGRRAYSGAATLEWIGARGSPSGMDLHLTTCPACGLPAEVLQRRVLPSTAGPVEHVKTRCITGHWFFAPAR